MVNINHSLVKQRLVLVGIFVSLVVATLAFSAVSTALDTLKTDLHATPVQLQWVMNIFGLTMGSTFLAFGRLADIYGRKKLFLLGLILLTISMLGSGFAKHIEWIIFFQAILGFAGGIITPVSLLILTEQFPAAQRKKAIGLWAAALGLSIASGSLISGLIVTLFGGQWVFLYNVPLVVMSFLLIAFTLQESRGELSLHADFGGMVLLLIAVSTLVLSITQAGSWPLLGIMGLLAISACVFLLLGTIESKAKTPLINATVVKSRSFIFAGLATCFAIFFVWTCFYMMPLHLQVIHHYTTLQAGCVMLLVTAPFALLSLGGNYIFQGVPVKSLLNTGFVLLLFSALIQMYFHSENYFLPIALGSILFGTGWGLIWEPATVIAVSALPSQQSSISTGCLLTIQVISGTLGMALTVSLARAARDLNQGYYYAMWVLVLICIAGFIVTKYVPTMPQAKEE